MAYRRPSQKLESGIVSRWRAWTHKLLQKMPRLLDKPMAKPIGSCRYATDKRYQVGRAQMLPQVGRKGFGNCLKAVMPLSSGKQDIRVASFSAITPNWMSRSANHKRRRWQFARRPSPLPDRGADTALRGFISRNIVCQLLIRLHLCKITAEFLQRWMITAL